MSFPNTPLVDDFTGTNGSINGRSVSGNTWNVDGGDVQIVSNQISSVSSAFGSAIYGAIYNANCEVWVTLVAPPNGASGYTLCSLRRQPDGSTYYVIWSTDTHMQIRCSQPFDILTDDIVSMAAGDKMGLQAIGNTLTCYRKPAAGNWTVINSVTDTTINAQGKIQLVHDSTGGGTIVLDDFGGGSLSSSVAKVATATPSTRGVWGRTH